jgi:predicted nucleic acid-binding protein
MSALSVSASGLVAESTIHLDTCFLIHALVPDSDADARLRGWLSAGHRISMNSVAWTEFLCGPLTASDLALAEQVVTERLDYSEFDARRAAEFFNSTVRRRGTLVDCMIAASACERDAPLATLNPKDFIAFQEAGLRLAV